MKKLLLFCTVFFVFASASKAQVINDTLSYFTNKQLYRISSAVPPTATSTIHPIYRLNASVITNTTITHVGSVYKSKQPVDVSALVGRCLRPALSVSQPPGGVPLRLYLCNVVNGLPVFPPVDSVTHSVLNNVNKTTGQLVGGNLNSVRTMSADFAVLIRCISGQDGDSVHVLRTAGHTATSTTAPNPANRFGEGLGVVRNAGVWYKTTNYAHPAFGAGTDYEFCLSPVVQYTLEVGQIESPTQSGACCWEVFTNTNTSSPAWSNQQFNFNEFWRVWKPFGNNMPGSFIPDSVFAWNLGDGSPTYYSPHGWDTVHLSFVSGNCNQFYTGNFTALHKKQHSLTVPSYSAGYTYTSSTVYCGNDTAGTSLRDMGSLANLKVYPNPTADRTTISGLKGHTSIYVYDMLGQLVSTQMTDKEIYTVDLQKQPRGNYMIRISNDANRTRVVKLLKE